MNILDYYKQFGVVPDTTNCTICNGLASLNVRTRRLKRVLVSSAIFLLFFIIVAYIVSMFVLYHTNFVVK